MSLTEKQKMFADEYLIDPNATRAYKAVYKNCKTDKIAAACANRLLRNANVKSYIDKELKKIHSEKTADAQEVIEYLTAVMRGKSKSEVVVVEGKGDGVSSARCMKKLPDEKEKLKAAELLGKRFSIFTDKLDVSGEVKGVMIINDIPKYDKTD